MSIKKTKNVSNHTHKYIEICKQKSMKFAEWILENRMFIGVFLLTIFFVSLPIVYKDGIILGHDQEYHVLRIKSLYEGVKSGYFPVRINPVFMNGYGYGSSLFYPDLFLYIPVLLQMMGFDLDTTIRIFVVLILAGSFLVTYYCAKGISKSRHAAIVAAAICSLSQYNIVTLYHRFALGEILAFAFLPFIIYGLYNFIYEKFDKPWLFVLGFTCVFYSHTITSVVIVIVVFFALIFSIRHWYKDFKRIIRLLISAGITVLLTCGLWMTIFEQMLHRKFGFNHPWADTVGNSMSPGKLFRLQYDVGIFGFSIILLCFVSIFIVSKKRKTKQYQAMRWLMIIGFILLFVTTTLFPWDKTPRFLEIIQFPWRFFAPITICLSTAVGIISCLICTEEKYRNISAAIFIVFMVVSVQAHIESSLDKHVVMYEENTFDNVENTFKLGLGEWMPEYVNSAHIPRNEPVVTDQSGNELYFEKESIKTTIDYYDPCEFIDVPLLYYKGYSAVFIDEDDKRRELPISENGPLKTIRIDCSGVTEQGEIVVDYTGTAAQKISLFISCAAFFAVIVFLYYNYRKKKSR